MENIMDMFGQAYYNEQLERKLQSKDNKIIAQADEIKALKAKIAQLEKTKN